MRVNGSKGMEVLRNVCQIVRGLKQATNTAKTATEETVRQSGQTLWKMRDEEQNTQGVVVVVNASTRLGVARIV